MEYKVKMTFEGDGFVVRVHTPTITPEERDRQMKRIRDSAEKLLKVVPTK